MIPQNNSDKRLKTKHILLPIILGLLGVGCLFWKDFSNISTSTIEFTWNAILFIVLAYLAIIIRDLSGMIRLYMLTDKQLKIPALFRIRMLYEFTSAITPSAAGGSTLEILFIHKEGLPVSKSTAITIVELFLDEAFFVLIFPLLIIFIPINELFAINGTFNVAFWTFFLVAYAIKVIWVFILFWSIFINPQFITKLISLVFSLKFLKKWRFRATKTAVEIKTCSKEMRHKSFRFWLLASSSSFILWSARFIVVNLLIMAFNPVTEHLLIYGRQVITMVVMLIAPTPGGSGFIEILFNDYLGEFITPGLTVILIGLIWRIFTYYQYMAIGVILIPNWLRTKKVNDL